MDNFKDGLIGPEWTNDGLAIERGQLILSKDEFDSLVTIIKLLRDERERLKKNADTQVESLEPV